MGNTLHSSPHRFTRGKVPPGSFQSNKPFPTECNLHNLTDKLWKQLPLISSASRRQTATGVRLPSTQPKTSASQQHYAASVLSASASHGSHSWTR